jgi:hypothetical protein
MITKRIFTNTQKETIAEYPREHFLTRHFPLLIGQCKRIFSIATARRSTGSGNFDAPDILSQDLCTEITCPIDVFEQ